MNQVYDEVAPHGPVQYSLDGLIALLDLSRDIGVCADFDSFLRRVEVAALRVLDCERLTVFLNEPLTNALRSRHATGCLEIRTPAGRGIAGATLREGHVINVQEASADPRFYDAIDRQTGFHTRSLLSVPLRGIDNETTGVLQLLNKRHGQFSETDEELAVTLGALTGISLQRQILFEAYREKQRLDHDLRLARNIQRSLLPAIFPECDGFDIVAWTQPAAATGGDFYDFFDLPDGRVGLVVADVAGHGLAASLLACETRALIRAAMSTVSLDEIVRRTNEVLYRDLHHERFVILLLGALDTSTGRLEYVGAGCAPLVYRSATQTCAHASATIPPLGILPSLPTTIAAQIALGPGDIAVAVTDGFYEWEDGDGEQFGLDRVRDSVRHGAGHSGDDMIASLYRQVLAHAGPVGKQADDLTAMVVKRVH